MRAWETIVEDEPRMVWITVGSDHLGCTRNIDAFEHHQSRFYICLDMNMVRSFNWDEMNLIEFDDSSEHWVYLKLRDYRCEYYCMPKEDWINLLQGVCPTNTNWKEEGF